jgi:hypothetical protein
MNYDIFKYTATWNAAHHDSGSQPFCRGAFYPWRSFYLKVSVARSPLTASDIGLCMLSSLVFKGFCFPDFIPEKFTPPEDLTHRPIYVVIPGI